jgi:hypothetical protein
LANLVSTQAELSFGSACFSTVPSIARTDKGFAETLSVLTERLALGARATAYIPGAFNNCFSCLSRGRLAVEQPGLRLLRRCPSRAVCRGRVAILLSDRRFIPLQSQ